MDLLKGEEKRNDGKKWNTIPALHRPKLSALFFQYSIIPLQYSTIP